MQIISKAKNYHSVIFLNCDFKNFDVEKWEDCYLSRKTFALSLNDSYCLSVSRDLGLEFKVLKKYIFWNEKQSFI